MSQALDRLDLVSDISQLISLYLLLQDASNSDLMKHLDRQDKEYLEKIIQKLDNIEDILLKLYEKRI